MSRSTVPVLILLLPSALLADDIPRTARLFLEAHCYDCHTGAEADGGLDLEKLGGPSDDGHRARWIRVFDRVRLGEMPPGDVDPLQPERRDAFLDTLSASLTTAHESSKGTVLRRLNRREYENTLNDMFGTNLDLISLLPEDGRSHEFQNVGSSLSVSMVQLERYLESARLVLETAIASSLAPPESRVVSATYATTRGGEKFFGNKWLKRNDGSVVFFARLGYPTGMLREANVREPGRYKVRVTGYAFQSDDPITFSIGATTFARGADRPTFGYYAMPPGEPTTVEIEAWIESRYMIQVEPWGISDAYAIKRHGIDNYRGPGLAILNIDVEGPLTDEFPSRGHRLLFDGLDRREIEPRNPRDKQKSWYRPQFEIATADADRAVLPILQRVASRAFRRPVDEAAVAAYHTLFLAERKGGATVEEALRTAVAAILCAPDFLYLREQPGTLDEFALASRLSYFLTRTLPDEALLKIAADGRLSEADVLRSQTDRLLADARFERFVTDFADAWLDLRNIDFTNPDRLLYPEFDPFLKHSMIRETRAFLDELFRGNERVQCLVKSDFAMLNNRLAEHYGIDGVVGPDIRRIDLPPRSLRGGFLTHGAVLKVSANGTNTSPVVRGAWVMERILGQTPPPPPAGVSGVEPDIRGATTLRELLDKHRNQDTCRACHRQIDPPGFALESFNPVGGWRERFRKLGEGDRVDLQINGNRVRYRLGPNVDASGTLADGRPFKGFAEFRDLLAADEDALARAFATKLLTFATGREMGFSDRPRIEEIVRQSRASGHGVRDLLHLVIGSEIFRTK